MWLEAADARLSTRFLPTGPIGLKSATYLSWPDQTSNHNNAASSGAKPSIGSDSYGKFLRFAPAAGTCQKMQVPDSASLQLGTDDFALVVVADYNDDPSSLTYMMGKQLQNDPWRGFGLFGSMTQTGGLGGQLGADYGKSFLRFYTAWPNYTTGPADLGEAPGASGAPSVFVMRRQGDTMQIRVNGNAGASPTVLAGVAGVDVSAAGAPLEIGCRNTSTHAFTGRLYSVGVIRTTVDDATIVAFENHLMKRYHLN
jgi:hypothetical protein